MAKQIILEKLEKQDYSTREAFNSLRTNLQFCGDDIKIIAFTSCTPNEGKSTVTMELARSFGEDDKKVILIDADLRKSVLVGHYGIHYEGELYGFSHYLSGQKKLDDVICHSNIPGVDILLAGPSVPNPTELLGNHYFEDMLTGLRDKYDIILIDCPPLGSVIDMAVIAPKCDGAVLVVESRAISYRFLQDIKKQLDLTGVRILGAVLNKVEREKGGYYNRYYGGYYKKYGGKYEKYGEYGQEK